MTVSWLTKLLRATPPQRFLYLPLTRLFIQPRVAPALTVSGMSNIQRTERGRLYFYNHIDHISDAGFLTYALFYGGFSTPHNITGGNLAKQGLIRRLWYSSNKAVFIPRDRASADSIQTVQALLAQGESISYANTKGRCGDGLYLTNPNIVAASAAGQEFSTFSQNTTIHGISISYEHIPSAAHKATQVVVGKLPGDDKRDYKDFFAFKGGTHIAISAPLVAKTPEQVATAIDAHIRETYREWPSTKAAQLLLQVGLDERAALTQVTRYAEGPAEAQAMRSFIASLSTLNIGSHDQPTQARIKTAFCEIYAGPNRV